MYFYTIDSEYLEFLKAVEAKVPNYKYEEHEKFFFGIVLTVNEKNYYVPVSSKKIKNATTMMIKEEGRAAFRELGSLRLGYMLPVPDGVLEKVDVEWLRKTKGPNYADLVDAEFEFCKSNIEKIYKRAESVYFFGTHKENKFNRYCCDFLALEDRLMEWIKKKEE